MYVAQGIADQAELRRLCEAAYNVRAAVPESAALIAGWQRDAAAWRAGSAGANAEYDLSYLAEADGGSARTRLDLFWPPGADRAACPLVMFIHGGYWQALGRKTFSHLAAGPNAHGIAVAMPSYGLCPDVDLATIRRQIAAACLWLWHRAGRRFAVSGHSAGGHLTAAMLAHDFTGLDAAVPANLVCAGLAVSGLFDLRDLVHTSINDKVALTEGTAQALSPLFAPVPAAGTLTAHVGELESEAFHWQSRALVRAWGAAGMDADYVSAPGANHFTVVSAMADPQSALARALARTAAPA